MQINLTSKRLKEYESENAYILQANDKIVINIDRATTLGYEETLDFNQQILQNTQEFVFKQHFLQIKEVLGNESTLIFVTQPYTCNLQTFIERQVISQKMVRNIFDQIIKAVYSIHENQYSHRNIRAEHFVLVGNLWKLQSLVYSEDYSKANGIVNEYLWSSKHQAPQFVVGKKYTEEQFSRMVVWNLGCILLHLILGSHRLSNKDILQKFVGQPFTMKVLKIKSERVDRFSQDLKDILGQMLHYDPLKRMTLKNLFLSKFLSEDVSNHFKKVNQAVLPPSKINLGRSVIRKSAINPASSIILKDFCEKFAWKQKQRQLIIVQSKLKSLVVPDEEFTTHLKKISQIFNGNQLQIESKKELIPSLEQLIKNNILVRKIMELYKSYHDQSQLLILALDSIDKLEHSAFSKQQEKELKVIIKHSIIFVSLLKLDLLAQGFNRNQNIFKLDTDEFTVFQNSNEYLAFQRLINYKRNQRAQFLSSFTKQIKQFKQGLLDVDRNLYSLIEKDFTKTTFNEIKVSYRLIIKYAYDSIREQYNRLMSKQEAQQLAQTAMLITYCLTVDKLYLKKHIADNFKYFFKWLGQQPSTYVPLAHFKDYIMKAGKDVLIQHSKYVLQRYFNI